MAKDPRFLHADSIDSNQSGQMPRLSESSLGAQVILLVLSCSESYTRAVRRRKGTQCDVDGTQSQAEEPGCCFRMTEPQHNISNKMTWASSERLDQPEPISLDIRPD